MLTALNATQSQHARLLALLQSPQSVRVLRARACAAGAPPVLGDLLSAMRRRRGWTQERLAAEVGVVQATVARWERGERTPSAEQVQGICFRLGATVSEVEAFTRADWTPGGGWGREPADEQTLGSRLRQVATGPARGSGFTDLEFLALEADAWRLVQERESARGLLAAARGEYAHYLFMRRDLSGCARYVDRALQVLDRNAALPDGAVKAVIRRGGLLAGERGGSARAARWLTGWLSAVHSPDTRAWMLAELAHHLLGAGETESALKCGAESTEICTLPAERFFRLSHFARLLAQAGRPEGSFSLLGERTPDAPARPNSGTVSEALTRAEAFGAAQERDQAERWLRHAFAACEAMDAAEMSQTPYCWHATATLGARLGVYSAPLGNRCQAGDPRAPTRLDP